MEWHASLYCLCDDPSVPMEDLVIGYQHIKPMPFPEQKVWPPARGGGGRGGRRVGRGRGRGRGAAGRGVDPAGAMAALEDDEREVEDEAMSGSGVGSGSEGEPLAEDSAEEFDDESGDGFPDELEVEEVLVDKDLEAILYM